jgi:hypothetical protein
MPSLFRDFSSLMGNTMGAREYWHEWYDVKGQLLDAFDPSKSLALLVDIGGGKGHDLIAFDTTFGSKGQLVLQDLSQVLDKVAEPELGGNIMKMPYDFFTEQPVKGKQRKYYRLIQLLIGHRCERLLSSPHPP